VGVAVVSLCLVQFMDVLGVTVVVTSLPAMLASLHAPESFGSLIATGYAMFFGGLLMLGARLGDRYGHRRTILASLAVFTVGALMAATAPSVLALAAGRCLQGAAAAASVPSALRLLTTLTEEGRARHRAIAAWSAAGAAAPSGRGPPRPAAGPLCPAPGPPRPGPTLRPRGCQPPARPAGCWLWRIRSRCGRWWRTIWRCWRS
jgi:MFS family permease